MAISLLGVAIDRCYVHTLHASPICALFGKAMNHACECMWFKPLTLPYYSMERKLYVNKAHTRIGEACKRVYVTPIYSSAAERNKRRGTRLFDSLIPMRLLLSFTHISSVSKNKVYIAHSCQSLCPWLYPYTNSTSGYFLSLGATSQNKNKTTRYSICLIV